MRLVLIPDDGEPVDVPGRRFVLGRDPSCDLVLDDDQVSRRHALIERTEDGRVVVRNLASRNGTFLDGTRIDESAELSGDQALRVGRTTLRARVTDGPGDDATMAVAARPAGLGGAEALPAAIPGYSMVQRLVVEAMSPEMQSLRSMKRKNLLVRGLGAFCGSVIVAVLWRILS